jgi:hypothetical protein
LRLTLDHIHRAGVGFGAGLLAALALIGGLMLRPRMAS